MTGALGFVGYRLSRTLINLGHHIIGVDGLEDAAYPNIGKLGNLEKLQKQPTFEFIRESWPSPSSKRTVLDSELDVIVNLAALPGLNTSWQEPEKLFRSNSALVQNLLTSLVEKGTEVKLIHASTSSVYGTVVPQDEDGLLLPVSPYGVSKLAAENLIKIYTPYLSKAPAILRLFSLYGPGQRDDMGYHKFIRQALNNEDIHITGSAKQSRRNTFIDDAVMAFVGVIESGVSGTFNVVGDDEITLEDAVKTITELADYSARIVKAPARFGDQHSTNGSNSRLKAATGWSPKTDFQTGIKAQFEWQKGTSNER